MNPKQNSTKIDPNSGGFYILLFDPNKHDLAHTKSMLKPAFSTMIATGEQSFALNMLADNAELIDLIMIDDKPQATDCSTFIGMIKEIKETIPIILLSSREVFLSATLIQTGVCLTITKPISDEGVKSLQRYTIGWRARNLKNGRYIEHADSASALLFGNSNKRRQSDEGSSFVPDKRGKGIMLNADKSNGRRRCRTYTDDLHMKCIQLLNRRNQVPGLVTVPKPQALSLTQSPMMPSSSIPCQFKNKEMMDLAKSNTEAISMTSDRYLYNGFPNNGVLGGPTYGGNALTVLNNTAPLILNNNPWVLSNNSGSSSHQSYNNNYNNNNFGGKTKINNDFSKFAKLIENQTSILSAVHGEYAMKLQESGLQLQASPFYPAPAPAPPPPPPPPENDICLSTIDFNEEENTLLGISFAPITTTYEQTASTELDFGNAGGFGSSSMQLSNAPTAEEELDTEIWLQQIMAEKEGRNSVADDIIEVSMEDHSSEAFDVGDLVLEGDTELHDITTELRELLNSGDE